MPGATGMTYPFPYKTEDGLGLENSDVTVQTLQVNGDAQVNGDIVVLGKAEAAYFTATDPTSQYRTNNGNDFVFKAEDSVEPVYYFNNSADTTTASRIQTGAITSTHDVDDEIINTFSNLNTGTSAATTIQLQTGNPEFNTTLYGDNHSSTPKKLYFETNSFIDNVHFKTNGTDKEIVLEVDDGILIDGAKLELRNFENIFDPFGEAILTANNVKLWSSLGSQLNVNLTSTTILSPSFQVSTPLGNISFSTVNFNITSATVTFIGTASVFMGVVGAPISNIQIVGGPTSFLSIPTMECINLLATATVTGLTLVATGPLGVTASTGPITGTSLVATVGGVSATGGVTAATGDITALLGDLTALVGDIVATLGDVNILQGNLNVLLGNIVVTAGTLDVVAGTTTLEDLVVESTADFNDTLTVTTDLTAITAISETNGYSSISSFEMVDGITTYRSRFGTDGSDFAGFETGSAIIDSEKNIIFSYDQTDLLLKLNSNGSVEIGSGGTGTSGQVLISQGGTTSPIWTTYGPVDWANPGTIGSTTPNTGVFTTQSTTAGGSSTQNSTSTLNQSVFTNYVNSNVGSNNNVYVGLDGTGFSGYQNGALVLATDNKDVAIIPTNVLSKRTIFNTSGAFGPGGLFGTSGYVLTSSGSTAAPTWSQYGPTNWANPGTIGSTTPNTGAFTTLTASSLTTTNPNNAILCNTATSGKSVYIVHSNTTDSFATYVGLDGDGLYNYDPGSLILSSTDKSINFFVNNTRKMELETNGTLLFASAATTNIKSEAASTDFYFIDSSDSLNGTSLNSGYFYGDSDVASSVYTTQYNSNTSASAIAGFQAINDGLETLTLGIGSVASNTASIASNGADFLNILANSSSLETIVFTINTADAAAITPDFIAHENATTNEPSYIKFENTTDLTQCTLGIAGTGYFASLAQSVVLASSTDIYICPQNTERMSLNLVGAVSFNADFGTSGYCLLTQGIGSPPIWSEFAPVDWANPGAIGSTTPNTGVFTSIQGPIGDVTPDTGVFTSIQGSIGDVTPDTGEFTSIQGPIGNATPNTGEFTSIQGPIGNVTPNTGEFTTLDTSAAGISIQCDTSTLNSANFTNYKNSNAGSSNNAYVGLDGSGFSGFQTGALVLATDNKDVAIIPTNITSKRTVFNTSGAFGPAGSFGTSGYVLTSAGSASAPTWAQYGPTNWASPGAIGSTTPNTGVFTYIDTTETDAGVAADHKTSVQDKAVVSRYENTHVSSANDAFVGLDGSDLLNDDIGALVLATDASNVGIYPGSGSLTKTVFNINGAFGPAGSFGSSGDYLKSNGSSASPTWTEFFTTGSYTLTTTTVSGTIDALTGSLDWVRFGDSITIYGDLLVDTTTSGFSWKGGVVLSHTSSKYTTVKANANENGVGFKDFYTRISSSSANLYFTAPGDASNYADYYQFSANSKTYFAFQISITV